VKIRSLVFADPSRSGWSVDRLELGPAMNLFVGASGSGKTRLLNILFNIGLLATKENFYSGTWTLSFEHRDVRYTWKYHGAAAEDPEERQIESEELWVGTPEHIERRIFERTPTDFAYEGKTLPRLAKHNSGIYLLREDEAIKPIHEGFSRIMRRRFWSEDLSASVNMQSTPRHVIARLKRRPNLEDLFMLTAPLHVSLYLLKTYFPQEYEVISDQFTRVFPFVERIDIGRADEVMRMPLGADIPVAVIKERGISQRVPLNEIASGMQKVLLIIVDIITSPDDLIYMIDEYENSLGVNAIDFLPAFIAECGGARQFIVTTHHPLLINAIPVRDWYVFHRKGLSIRVTHGHELESRYGSSKQQRFIQLINDPLYTDGVE
jgi:AAA domain, putative AbiEii toxin, Type IV TA system